MRNIRKSAALLALVLCLLLCLSACGKADDGIVGSWQAEADVLGEGVTEEMQSGDNYVVFSFNEDMTGDETHIISGSEHDVRTFTYSLSDGVLTITYDEGGSVVEFPYRLEDGNLVLTQNRADITYEKVS